MTDSTNSGYGNSQAHYDISASLRAGVSLEDFCARAESELVMPAANIARLQKAFQSGSTVQMGKDVPKERADKAKADFERIGLRVILTPVLSIQEKVIEDPDGKTLCPACDTRVFLPANRQCPACNIFVDKVTPEMLMRRKILAQERAFAEAQISKSNKDSKKRAQEQMEKTMREEIRREMEEEYGLGGDKVGLFTGKAGIFRALGAVVMVGAALAAGRYSAKLPMFGGEASSSAAQPQAGAGQGKSTPKAQDIDKLVASMEEGVAASPGSGAALGTDDLNDEESLLRSARNGGPDAKGIPIDKALMAAQTLAKAAGNTTAERALAGTSANSGAGAGTAGKAGGGAGAGTATASDAPLPPPTEGFKAELSAEFAVTLAQLGQTSRAREILKALQLKPQLASDAAASEKVKLADLSVQAWSISSSGNAKQRLATLQADLAKLVSPSVRAIAYARVSGILSQNPSVPRELANAFLAQGAEALKTVSDTNEQTLAMAQWTMAMGASLASGIAESAKMGQMAKAQSTLARFPGVIASAPTAHSIAHLRGLEYLSKRTMGQTEAAEQSLTEGLAAVKRAEGLAEQADALRALIAASQTTSNARLQEALSSLQKQSEAETGAGRMGALTGVALVYATEGSLERYSAVRDLALRSPGVAPDQASQLGTSMLVRGDMALAQVRHAQVNFAEVERLLLRVADYLF